jgi:putative transposase
VDLYSSIVVGWSMSHRQERQLVIQAVLMGFSPDFSDTSK